MGAYKRRYRDETTGKIVTEDQWRYRRLVTLPDGTKERITGTPELNTKAAALIAEESHIKRVLNQDKVQDAGTFSAFWNRRWWPTVTGTPSTRQEKENPLPSPPRAEHRLGEGLEGQRRDGRPPPPDPQGRRAL